jgi:hypothetical protein
MNDHIHIDDLHIAGDVANPLGGEVRSFTTIKKTLAAQHLPEVSKAAADGQNQIHTHHTDLAQKGVVEYVLVSEIKGITDQVVHIETWAISTQAWEQFQADIKQD